MTEFNFQDISVNYKESILTIANREIERVIDLAAGYPRTVSFRRKNGDYEYASPDRSDSEMSFIGITPPDKEGRVYQVKSVEAKSVAASLFDSEHVEVEMIIVEPIQGVRFRRVYTVYPEFPAISVRNFIQSAVMPMVYWLRGRPSLRANQQWDISYFESCADSLKLAAGMHCSHSVEFVGRTDVNDELVLEHCAKGREQLNGNLLWCAFPDSAGVLFLQEAPPSEERRDLEKYDFRISAQSVYSCSWGIPPSEIVADKEFTGYRHTLIAAKDAVEREQLLKHYLKLRFPMKPENCSIMVNPWGCGIFRDLVSEEFLKEEIAAAGAVGAECYQIDDTWQEGVGLSEMIYGNRKMTPAFWEISQKRLHGTFETLLPVAKEAGVELALWYAPSCNVEYRDRESFRDFLLDFHKRWGFNNFKIDGVLLRSYEAEENLEWALRSAREASEGKIYFNLDVTNGQRGGYFRFLEYGNLFLENRYVCHTWGLGYHPEKTLRSFWKLAKYVRSQSLQIEIPNPGDIRREFYVERQMTQPDTYSFEYWIALAAFANPLLWMAPSKLSPENRETLRKTLALFKTYHKEIMAGDIYPVGGEPDGNAVTGFYSTSGYLILLREQGAPESALIELPHGKGEKWMLAGGKGSVTTVPGGVAAIISNSPRFAFFRAE